MGPEQKQTQSYNSIFHDLRVVQGRLEKKLPQGKVSLAAQERLLAQLRGFLSCEKRVPPSQKALEIVAVLGIPQAESFLQELVANPQNFSPLVWEKAALLLLAKERQGQSQKFVAPFLAMLSSEILDKKGNGHVGDFLLANLVNRKLNDSFWDDLSFDLPSLQQAMIGERDLAVRERISLWVVEIERQKEARGFQQAKKRASTGR